MVNERVREKVKMMEVENGKGMEKIRDKTRNRESKIGKKRIRKQTKLTQQLSRKIRCH